jgi:hypothetical protein
MTRTETPKTSPPKAGAKQECCTDAPCDSGLRNQYFDGKRLTADSFRVEQTYLIERRRLLNRAIHGWGVVYGYPVKGVPLELCHSDDPARRLEIGAGLALDACGRELLQVTPATLSVADVILLDAKGERLERPPEGSYEPRPKENETKYEQAKREDDDKVPRACWLLRAHYAEQLVGPQPISDPCSCERHEWDHVCEKVRYSLTRIDCKDCCQPFDCELTCECGTGACCGKHDSKHADPKHTDAKHGNPKPGDELPQQGNPVRRGGCQCLCEHLTGLALDEKCSCLKPIDDPCAHIKVDWRHGVPLACVSLREGECDWVFGRWIEACGPRRLVKRNDALFDLIRGCDLTRISAIGWARWHRSPKRVEWEPFKASFGVGSDHERETRGKSKKRPKKVPVLTTDYWVEFSRPVVQDTVQPDCFSMTVLAEEDEGGWTEVRRVPILAVKHWAPPGTPPGLVTKATLMVDEAWLYDAVRGDNTIFNEDPTTVEIEIRGDLIVDCNGQSVDANASGLLPAPSGNGTPGGTFFSSFNVQPRYDEYRIEDESAERAEGV